MNKENYNAEDTCLTYHHDEDSIAVESTGWSLLGSTVKPSVATNDLSTALDCESAGLCIAHGHGVNPPNLGPSESMTDGIVTSHASLAAVQKYPLAKPEIELQSPKLSSSEAEEEPGLKNGISLDLEETNFPEGGFRAWSVVLGSFCGLFSVFGIINSTAVFQEYLSANQLSQYSPGQIGWIFSVELFLAFFCGVPTGPIFDAHGPRLLVMLGSIFLVSSMMLVGFCTEYWHFIMVYSVLGGLGGALVNTAAIASIGHFFLTKRGTATGIAMTSGSLGGIVFPLIFQKTIPVIGFAWATRIAGFILLFLLIFANLLIRARLPEKKGTKVWPDLSVFTDPIFTLVTVGIFLLEWAIFIPLTYICSYAVANGASPAFSFQVLAVVNAGSFFGRLCAGWVADILGRFNTLIITISLCIVSILALWLPARGMESVLVVFAAVFGVASGSNLSLAPVCVGQLCKTEKYGQYFATCWMIASFGSLTGVPIAGQILSSSNGSYSGLIIFAGLSYASGLICFVVARLLAVGWRIKVFY